MAQQDLLWIEGAVNDSRNIPEALKAKPIWLVWKREQVQGRMTKVPYNAKTGGKAASNDPATWSEFDAALRALQTGAYSGLGIGIAEGIAAIDIDHCITGGALSDMARDIVARMNSYTETSPSGEGIRILFAAPGFVYDKARYYINNQRAGLEVYIAGCTSKYVTITGKVIHDMPISERTTEIAGVLEAYMKRPTLPKMEKSTRAPAPEPPAPGAAIVPNKPVGAPRTHTFGCSGDGTNPLSDTEIVQRALAAANGDAFRKLWFGECTGFDSRSEADLALCNHLAFWSRGDAAQIDRLYRASNLYRDKWEREDYRATTIQKAIGGCTSFHDPKVYNLKAPGGRPRSALIERLRELHPEMNRLYRWTDIGSGQLFADVYKGTARFVPERKKWFVYSGKRWEVDVEGLYVMALCKQLADQLMIYALAIEDEKVRKDYMEYVGKWQTRAFRERVIKDASSVHYVSIDRFDRHPYLLNCLNGTLDLITNVFREHRPADLLCKLANVSYDPEAQSERWERFIMEVMQGDIAKATFLQKALGYALTGDTSHECFFILYGATSRNGKGTTMETFLRMIGDYGKSAKPDTIAQRQQPNGGGPSEDIARLAGARFVNISEPDKKLILSAALVKTLTGNDTIIARHLHENSFEYKPEFKLFVNTNYLPQVTDVTLFSSGRVKVIPFERHFSENERDRDLKADLAKPENLSGILNWCIEGLKWIEELGFDAPQSVMMATEAYQMDSDKFSRFLEEEFIKDSSSDTSTAEAYVRFLAWCARNGFQAENSKNFKAGMNSCAVIRYKRPAGSNRYANPTNMLVGYRLISTVPQPDRLYFA